MRSFAMTYPQLMNQAVAAGFADADLVRLRDAHALACGLVDGLYRKYSTPFLCHLTRTASITMSETRSTDVVLAALLHAVYFLNTFDGSSRRGPRKSDRDMVRSRIGPVAEELITLYGEADWHQPEVLEDHAANAGSHPPHTQGLLLIVLANELEDHLDAAEAYAGSSGEVVLDDRYAAACIALAEKLGHPELASDLREAFDLCRNASVASILRTGRHGSYEAKRLWRANPIERVGEALREPNRPPLATLSVGCSVLAYVLVLVSVFWSLVTVIGYTPAPFLVLSGVLAVTSVVFGILGLRTDPKPEGSARIAALAAIVASLLLLAGFVGMVLIGLGIQWLMKFLEPWPGI